MQRIFREPPGIGRGRPTAPPGRASYATRSNPRPPRTRSASAAKKEATTARLGSRGKHDRIRGARRRRPRRRRAGRGPHRTRRTRRGRGGRRRRPGLRGVDGRLPPRPAAAAADLGAGRVL
ncbi:hypothetical protein F9B16_38235, partial [Actinomadura montaniterrae]